MKVRIVSKFDKNTKQFLGYELETKTFPFFWHKVQEYNTMSERQAEHDALWLLEMDGKIKTISRYI